MNSLSKLKVKLVMSIIAKIILYLGSIPIFVYNNGSPGINFLGILFCISGVMNLIVNFEYGRMPHIFYMRILYNKKHGYFFYKTTEDRHDVNITIYENRYIYWDPITFISISHEDMERVDKEQLINKKINEALDEKFTSLQEKENAKRNRIKNKKKVNGLLSPKVEDSNKTFIEELNKLGND